MTKFNKKINTTVKTINRAGGQAYKQKDKTEFLSILLTSFLKDEYYRSSNSTLKEVKDLMNSISDKKFLAKCALYARNECGMRSITHVVSGELANSVKGEKWTKDYYNNVVHRVDDITEILGYYLTEYGKPLPNSLKKGLAKALNKFNAYQLAKYKGSKNAVKLVDVFNLIHPIPNKENVKTWKDLIEGKLKSFDTWESELSNVENEDKSKVWKNLLMENKLGYFALLRNLRNILKTEDDKIIKEACKQLVNKEAIKNSLVLPFRFSTAYDVIDSMESNKNVRLVLNAIDEAVSISCDNVPKFKGNTLVCVDVSGSMNNYHNIASLFASILCKTNNCDLMTFDDSARYINYNNKDTIMTIKSKMEFIGGGTDFKCIFSKINNKYDRIIILSDMQSWIGDNTPNSVYNRYCVQYKCKPKIFSFDLAGLGTVQFKDNNVQIAGISDKVFDMIKFIEKDKQTMVDEIEKVKL